MLAAVLAVGAVLQFLGYRFAGASAILFPILFAAAFVPIMVVLNAMGVHYRHTWGILASLPSAWVAAAATQTIVLRRVPSAERRRGRVVT